MSFLSEEDKKIAEELQDHIKGGDLDDIFGELETCHQCSAVKIGGDNIKFNNSTSVAISDSNDIRRVIADMLK
jgi:hypothetical protein